MDYSSKEDIIEYMIERTKYFIWPSQKNNYNSKFLQSDFLLYFVILMLVIRIIFPIISVNLIQNSFFADITKNTLENLANQTRQSFGLQVLTNNSKLDAAAELKAENMVQNQYFDHTSPTGITPWYWFSKVEYNYKYAGENLAIGFYDSKEVYDAWLNSPSHKENLLNPNYKEVGTAIINGFGVNNAIIVVQLFGSQQPVKTVPLNTNTKKPPTEAKPATIQPVVKTKPVAVQINPNPTNNSNKTNEKVLSESTKSSTVLQEPNQSSSNNMYYKFLNSVVYNYDQIMKNIIFGVSMIVIGILLAIIFFNSNIQPKRQLIFRSILIIGLLLAANILNKEIIISIIPHQISI